MVSGGKQTRPTELTRHRKCLPRMSAQRRLSGARLPFGMPCAPPKKTCSVGPATVGCCNNHVLTFEDGGTGGAQRASWRRYRQAAGAQRGRRGGGRREHLPAPAPEEQMQGVRGGEHLPAQVQEEHMQGVRGGYKRTQSRFWCACQCLLFPLYV